MLLRLEDIKKDERAFYFIGGQFEESGMCSIDMIKHLREHLQQLELEKQQFA